MTERLARAKINLALHIIGKRNDGFHELSSLVSFAEFGDQIIVREGAGAVHFHGEFAEGLDEENNSLIDAVNWFDQAYGVRSEFTFEVEKNIPVQAGLGGGTADAAEILRFLYAHHNLPIADPSKLAVLGADVPVCFAGGVSLMSGIGEQIAPTTLDRDYGLVLVNPRLELSTKRVFENMKRYDAPIVHQSCFTLEALKTQTNSMQIVAETLAPEIRPLADALNEGALLVRISGSGASVFALTTMGDEESLAKDVQKQFPEYWVCATQTKRA